MNMQDYRHAADRVQIAEHCKEEVLGMKENTITRKPAIRIVTGITAAAACLAVTGFCGYTLMHMNKQGKDLSAATQIESQIEEETPEVTTEPVPEAVAVEVEADDREFPMIDRMTEEMRTRTFDWGTIWLEDITDITNADGHFPVVLCEVKLNDDIEIADTDVIAMSCKGNMYDYQMQHKVSTADGTVQVVEKTPGEARDRLMMALYPLPVEGGTAVCLTRGDDGTYAERPGDDFLYKQPMPEYLLYELTVDRIAILDENGNEKRVLLDSADTPLFKARKLDLEAKIQAEIEEAFDKTINDLDEEGEEAPIIEEEEAPSTANLLDAPVEYQYEFGKVTVNDICFNDIFLVVNYTLEPADSLKEKCSDGTWLETSLGATFYNADGKKIAFTEQRPQVSVMQADDGTLKYDCNAVLYDAATDIKRGICVPAGSTMKLYVSDVVLSSADGEEHVFTENLVNEAETAYAPVAEVTLPYDAPPAIKEANLPYGTP